MMIIELFAGTALRLKTALGLGLIVGRKFALEITVDETRVLLPHLGEFYSDYGRTNGASWQSWRALQALDYV